MRNDACAALGAAVTSGASFVRVNVLAGAYLTDQGVIEGEAARVLAYRQALGATDSVQIVADVFVKHAVPLAPIDPGVAARDLAERSGASALIVSGNRTGEPVDAMFLATIKRAVGAFPVWLGSGLNEQNASALWPLCDGAIVGTALKEQGIVARPVDAERVRRLRRALSR